MSAPDPTCSALAAAKSKNNLSYKQIAEKVGASEERIVDIFTGKVKATTGEFSSISTALGVANAPHDSAHATIAS